MPVVPGMEGCHWPFRKAASGDWPKLLRMLLSGRPVKAAEAVGWLADFAGPLDRALQRTWQVATNGDHGLKRRPVETGALEWQPLEVGDLAEADSPAVAAARKAIIDAILSLGRSLRLNVVGEGIEQGEQAERLRSMGCTLAQGFFFGRPVPKPDIESLLAAHPSDKPAAD